MIRVLTIFLFLPFASRAQNLLPNGNLDEMNICKEYHMPCGPKGWFGVPIGGHYFSRNLAYDGPGGLQFMVYDFGNPKSRSFLETEILAPLRKDSSYIIEMLFDGDCIDVNKLSVYMPAEDFLFETKPYTSFTPAVSYTSENQLEKMPKRYWHKLHLSFKATGKERYFVIGNFSSGNMFSSCATSDDQVFYNIDNISLKPAFFTDEKISSSRLDALYNRTERHELLQDYITAKPAGSKPVKLHIDTLIIPDVLFATDDARLPPKAQGMVDEFLKGIIVSKLDSIVVEGHTDNTGSLQHNRLLSMQRAESTRAYITAKIPATVIARGLSSKKPVADNRTAQGRQKNRRVAIYLYMKN
jgi:outer membrane protein OmpA-like peptidoglycan-associated protein